MFSALLLVIFERSLSEVELALGAIQWHHKFNWNGWKAVTAIVAYEDLIDSRRKCGQIINGNVIGELTLVTAE